MFVVDLCFQEDYQDSPENRVKRIFAVMDTVRTLLQDINDVGLTHMCKLNAGIFPFDLDQVVLAILYYNI